MILLSENERIHQRITDMRVEFVGNVDPKGHIMDFLIGCGVVNDQTAEKLRKKETRQERCRSLLYELSSCGNPRAFVELQTALGKDYRFMVDKINEGMPVETVGFSSLDHCRQSIFEVDFFWSFLQLTNFCFSPILCSLLVFAYMFCLCQQFSFSKGSYQRACCCPTFCILFLQLVPLFMHFGN